MSWAAIRNGLLFLIGAAILVLELEFHDHTRGWVIVLSLFLMGIVTVDQVRSYVGRTTEPASWPRMPVEGLQHPQEPPGSQDAPRIAQDRPTRPPPPTMPPDPPDAA